MIQRQKNGGLSELFLQVAKITMFRSSSFAYIFLADFGILMSIECRDKRKHLRI